MPERKKYPPKRRMKFTPDPKNPDKKKTSMRDQQSPSDAINPKHGIYKMQPVAPAIPVSTPEAKKKKKSKKSLFGNRNYKIQHSSPEHAKKSMQKNVRKKQKGRRIGSTFNR
jgi:hypothetical protein